MTVPDRPTLAALVRIVDRAAIPAALVLVAAFALLDHLTGVEATFVVLTYLFPIAIVAWFRSRPTALAIAALATIATTWVFVSAQPAAHAPDVALDALGAFGMFAFAVFVLHALRCHVERERAQRRTAVEQLRHAERLSVIGTLAAGIAHELGTPLNVISGAAEMLGEDVVSASRVTELVSLIQRETERITAIVRHLLDFGRGGGAAPARAELDASVAGAAELLASTARKRDISMRLALAPGIGRVRANSRELEQVVSNLVLNGIQAMPRGGELTISTGLQQRPDGHWAAVVVEDEGDGIRPEHLPYIFDPFFTTKGIGEGTGLGLSVSYGIVRDWGGRIEVASEPGHGARFVVLIPLVDTAVPAAAA